MRGGEIASGGLHTPYPARQSHSTVGLWTMKLFSCIVLRRSAEETAVVDQPVPATVCCSAFEVSHLRLWERGGAREFLTFLSRTMAQRVANDSRVAVKEKEYQVYAQAVGANLVLVAIADMEYPMRVAFSMLSSLASQFTDTFRGRFEKPADAAYRDNYVTWPVLDGTVAQYQQPQDADPLFRVQKQIDETHVVMLGAIHEALKRGEDVDELLAQSRDLSTTSKGLYTASKKAGGTCACAVM
mgnify:CR=1 FL=1